MLIYFNPQLNTITEQTFVYNNIEQLKEIYYANL